ncbi:metal ABC transporter solute-binding protein, Zn/Mn family [Senegalia massiliensis]|uniref:ABC transporter substrate-binding protein n=1 Tax=Senegalia massiliensis TaxID=1720316 RepID=A0A845QVF9_9CLOT|nr:zinc ABC transporter substrate-binding protein [Senegalia massiliensis]NBI06060.1 ABC transporter substrate-binding protein [Senegalia massiliensis]
MKKIFIVLTILLVVLTGCTDNNNEAQKSDKLTVAAGIPPIKGFINSIAKEKIEVVTMIPPGNSPTNYQPSPKELQKFSDSKVYFAMGVPAEESNIIPKAKDLNEDMEIIHLANNIEQDFPNRYFEEDEEHSHEEDEEHSHEEGRDPHIWLSPKRVIAIVDIITDKLIELDSENEEFYTENSEKYKAELNQIDESIKQSLEGVKSQSFIIYHPSFGYFADDYGLNMVAIEESGKEASAKRITEVIDFAKENNIKFVFYQQEFSSSQAETIAEEIGGEAIKVDPLSENYIDNMKNISEKFSEVLN